MICLTSDIHHQSLKTGNQKYCDCTEIQVAQKYLKMLEEANIRTTFFISGKSFEQEWEDLRPIVENPLVEIGGHNYGCFVPALWHRIWKKLNNSYNGPRWYQLCDAQKTIDIIEQKTGKRIRCWRNHMYMHGPFTESILAECGIEVCSDGVSRYSNGPVWHPAGIYNFPINVMPDHEHLYHAERTPEYVAWFVKRYNWRDDYGPESYYIEEWTERVLDELKQHERDGIISNMIVHPITLYLCDRFRSFQKILDFISTRKTVHMTEVINDSVRLTSPAPSPKRQLQSVNMTKSR